MDAFFPRLDGFLRGHPVSGFGFDYLNGIATPTLVEVNNALK